MSEHKFLKKEVSLLKKKVSLAKVFTRGSSAPSVQMTLSQMAVLICWRVERQSLDRLDQ